MSCNSIENNKMNGNDKECPCDNCESKNYCDIWEAQFCCRLYQYNKTEHCNNCDPMDI